MATNILIVEDSEVVRARVIAALRPVALFDNFYEAANGVEALRILGTTKVDLILCDLMMPGMDGFEFITAMKANSELRDIPVIILSECGESDAKIKGLGVGARDYVTKPFDAGELLARITVQLNIKALQDEMRKTNALLREISITDHLTHLYNRRHMMEELETEFERCVRRKGDLCLVLVDVDHFKAVNDSYGHQRGDTVLAAIAEALQVELRRYDLAARYGGEEFALILPQTSLAEGVAVARRLGQAVQAIAFPQPMEGLVVTVSQGVAAVPSPGVDCVDAFIRVADDALYRAKQNGRNRIEIAGGADVPPLSGN